AGPKCGRAITIEHLDNNQHKFTTNYTHIDPISSPDIIVNKFVTKGTLIGTVTTLHGTTTDHLHFSIRRHSYDNVANRGALPDPRADRGDCTCYDGKYDDP